MNFHRYANIFPLLSDSELATLAEDIKSVGLHDPITLYQGDILDGRNRYKATIIAGIEPRYTTFEGTEEQAQELSYSRNFHRRNLTPGQKAAIASEWATMKRGRNHESNKSADPPNKENQSSKDEEKKSAKDAAEKFETSEKSIGDIRFIKRHRPDLAEQVAKGLITINAAKKIVQDELAIQRAKERAEAEAKRQTEADPPQKSSKKDEKAKAREEKDKLKAKEKAAAEKAEKERITKMARDNYLETITKMAADRYDWLIKYSDYGGKNVQDKFVAADHARWPFFMKSPIDGVVKDTAHLDRDFHLIDAMNWIGILPHSKWDTIEIVCKSLRSRFHPDKGEGSSKEKYDLTVKSYDMLQQHKHLFLDVPR